HGNVFEAAPQPKSCKIAYTLAGKKAELQWDSTIGVHPELRCVSSYDTESAHVYVNEENEMAYEPPLLAYFRRLVEVCEELDTLLAGEIAAKASQKPVLPPEYTLTESGTWFDALTHLTTTMDVESRCFWSEELDKQFVASRQRLAEPSP